MKKMLKLIAYININLGVFFLLMPFVLFVLLATGAISNDIFLVSVNANASKEAKILSAKVVDANTKATIKDIEIDTYFPIEVPFEGANTYGFSLTIPRLNVTNQIFESYDAEAALREGFWRDPSLGAPDTNQTTVIGGHRWGESDVSWEYRRRHLFLNLTEAVAGDVVEINWNNERYIYRVNYTEQNTYVSRLDDLILYTCIDLDSPLRYFVYAELIEVH